MKKEYLNSRRSLRISVLIILILSIVSSCGLMYVLFKVMSGNVEPLLTTLVAVLMSIISSLVYDNIMRTVYERDKYVKILDEKIELSNLLLTELTILKETILFVENSKSKENGTLLIYGMIQNIKIKIINKKLFENVQEKSTISLLNVINEKLVNCKSNLDTKIHDNEFLHAINSIIEIFNENIITLNNDKKEFLEEKERVEKALEGKRT